MNTKNDVEIIILDDLPPEVVAMLQALYSRDPSSVLTHIDKVKKEGAEKFMGTYYVGYGHKSIGDCGSTSLFIENVSMLAAKAVQDWPLYSGQEASTRYLDMSKQKVLNPLNSDQGQEIQNRWMRMYERILAKLIEVLPNHFPIKEGDDEKKYRKAIKAKAFDVARGFLPAGVTTYVSWHTNLRQAADHLKEMRHHPLEEIRNIAWATEEKLQEKYPGSFSLKRYADEELYLAENAAQLAFRNKKCTEFVASAHLYLPLIEEYRKIFESRPNKTDLPKQLRLCGDFSFEFLLDFGSFRDFQRQRSVIQPMPLLTTEYGFENWYLEQLSDDLKDEVTVFLAEQEIKIAALPCNEYDKQYYIGMGYQVPCVALAPLPAAVYIAELRSNQTVHPTLRKIAHKIGRFIENEIPGIALYCDYSEDEWTIKRGAHDIVKKEEVK